MQETIESMRLVLRPFSFADAEGVASLAGDKRIADMTANIPHPYRLSDAVKWIATHEKLFLSGKGIVYAIVKKGTDELIGTVSLLQLDNGSGVLGYWLGVPYWGNGYATEASRLLISFSQEHLGLKKVADYAFGWQRTFKISD